MSAANFRSHRSNPAQTVPPGTGIAPTRAPQPAAASVCCAAAAAAGFGVWCSCFTSFTRCCPRRSIRTCTSVPGAAPPDPTAAAARRRRSDEPPLAQENFIGAATAAVAAPPATPTAVRLPRLARPGSGAECTAAARQLAAAAVLAGRRFAPTPPGSGAEPGRCAAAAAAAACLLGCWLPLLPALTRGLAPRLAGDGAD